MPVRWTAPEALETQKYSTPTDVWSFGVVLYEMWTRAALPYSNWSNTQVWLKVLAGERLPQPDDCDDETYELMMMCWADDPTLRPSFEYFKFAFESWLKAYE